MPADGSRPPEPATKLEEGHGTHRFPHFLPDGRHFLFYASPGSGVEPGELRLGGLGSLETRLLAETSSAAMAPDCWTPDGTRVLFARRGTATGVDILIVGTDGGAEPREWLATPFNEVGADVSPDGHWVAYASDIGGSFNVYVKPLDGPGTPWQVSTSGGTSPRWSPRGEEIFYRSPANEIMAATVSASGGRFSSGAPVSLFAAGINDEQRDYDVAPDGQTFLLARSGDTAEAPLIVVLGFDRTLTTASP